MAEKICNLSKIGGGMKYELLGTTTSTSDVTLSNLDLTKYSAILLICSATTDMSVPNPVSFSICPLELFRISDNVQARWINNGTDRFVLAFYVNDTSLKLRVGRQGDSVWLYGVK